MKYLLAIGLGIIWLAAAINPAGAAENPGPQSGEKAWRVIYVEGGPYRDYHQIFLGLLQGLYELNLLSELPPPEEEGIEDSSLLWQWLAEKSPGLGLEFPADGFYSAAWDPGRLAEYKEEILSRARAGEVDLILAFGTAAGLATINDEHRVPTLSISVTDPVGAGLSLSAEDSGRDHVHAQVVFGAIEYQLAMFHNIFGFQTLGLPYDSTSDGRRSMGIPTVEKIAAERGITIVPCLAELEIEDFEESARNLKDCLDFLAPRSEAIYLPINNGLQPEHMASLLEPIIAHQRPSFSQTGPEDTRLGVLLSMGETDFINSGRFEAEALKKILNGATPRSLNQLYLPPLTMALNLKMARLIGWNPPFEVLAAMDELYNKVAGRE
jgi:ABC-type uncharacterized transport system substrate-binding protein